MWNAAIVWDGELHQLGQFSTAESAVIACICFFANYTAAGEIADVKVKSGMQQD